MKIFQFKLLDFILGLAIIMLFISGCSTPSAYIQVGNVQNVPLLNDSCKNHYSLNYGAWGFNINTAHTIKSPNSIMMDLSYINIKPNCETCPYRNRFLIDAAWGRYWSKNNGKILEGFAGVGYGNSNILDSRFFLFTFSGGTPVEEKAKFMQAFIQFDHGERRNYTEIAYSLKIVAPYYFDYTHIENPGVNETVNYYNNTWTIFLQPAVTTRGGFKHLKGEFQMGFSIPVMNFEFAKFSLFASVGLSIN